MTYRIALAAAAMFALAGCSGSDQPEAAASDAPKVAEAAPAASPAAAPAKGEKPSKEFVVGKWGTDGDCTLAMNLKADGTSDGPFGNWSYNDGVLTFADAPGLKINVTVIDEKTMESRQDDQSASKKMTRCP